jgi:hypothetical protein
MPYVAIIDRIPNQIRLTVEEKKFLHELSMKWKSGSIDNTEELILQIRSGDDVTEVLAYLVLVILFNWFKGLLRTWIRWGGLWSKKKAIFCFSI